MPPKLLTRQYTTNDGTTYLVFRYEDDNNNNYEYQVYELTNAIQAARNLGVSETREGRRTPLNTREMWDEVWETIDGL